MEKQNFTSSISAKISADEAIKKISNVPGWWGITFSGNSEKQEDKFIVKMGGDSFFDIEVAELIPGKRVVWLVTDYYMPWYEDKKEWAGTKMIFDLTENEGIATVNLPMRALHRKLTVTRTVHQAGRIGSKRVYSPFSLPEKVFSVLRRFDADKSFYPKRK